MRKLVVFSLPLVLVLVLAAFQPQSTPVGINDQTPVADVLKQLGAPALPHQVRTDVAGVSAAVGRQLVTTGIATTPQGGSTRRQSKHFVCTSCHNIQKEDPNLTAADPEARLAYAVAQGLPFLPGTTLYGVVNRSTYYNGDYEKKYGDLVRPARNDLRGAIALCATECAQGRELQDWEMESILAYLWTIGLTIGDLQLKPDELALVQRALAQQGNTRQAADLLQTKYLDHSPATFVTPPTDRKAGYGMAGDAQRGALLYEHSCLHCHGERRYSFFNLDTSAYSLDFLAKHFPVYTRYSTYQVVRYGTSPINGKPAYMPHFTQERMSHQQVEDLRAFLK